MKKGRRKEEGGGKEAGRGGNEYIFMREWGWKMGVVGRERGGKEVRKQVRYYCRCLASNKQSINQSIYFYFVTTRIHYTCTWAIKTKKYCYVVVTWHKYAVFLWPQNINLYSTDTYILIHVESQNRCTQYNLFDNIIYLTTGFIWMLKKLIIFCKSKQFVFLNKRF